MEIEHILVIAFTDDGEARAVIKDKEIPEDGFNGLLSTMLSWSDGVLHLGKPMDGIKWVGKKNE